MRELKVYNTLTRKKEIFVPVTPGQVKMYVCGITPYNHSHMGNARPFVTWDVIKRYLEHLGYEVTHIQNFTDVDDKIINAANGEGVTWDTISNRYIASYFDVMDKLHIRRADKYPRVSEHMDEIINMVEQLGEVDTTDVPVTSTVTEEVNVMREDVAVKGTDRTLLMKNVPEEKDGLIKVPAIIDESEEG